jgi:hypothetical protein
MDSNMSGRDISAELVPFLAPIHAKLVVVASTLPAPDIVLWVELRRAAVAYFAERASWKLAPPDGRPALEQGRTSAHNVFIDACNALSRRCVANDLDQDWRRELGDAQTMEGRKRIGDYACYLAFSLAIEAR